MKTLRLSNLTNRFRGGIFKCFSSFLFVFVMIGSGQLTAQTDTEFWFVVPEITWAHNPPGGVPANLRLSTMAFPATVTISMPANQYNATLNPTGFHDIVVNIPANSSYSVDMSPFIRLVPAVAGEPGEANQLENKCNYNSSYGKPSGVNNVGLYIHSTNVITAYYEDGNLNNSDIWSLKGKNALGTDFYTPFQNQTANHAVGPPYPYSAIDIVATEDNTVVTITPTKNAAYGALWTVIPAGTPYSIVLNKGQTFSVFPAGQARTAAAHLGGTHVTSNKPIAITLNDDSIDHIAGGCYDVVGDQLIPTSVIGWDYIAIRTQLNVQDHIYITATVNGTTGNVYYGATVIPFSLNAGQQLYVPFPTTASTMRIITDVNHPVYVFHIGGFGCEQGGAILPPVNVCTGSTQVAFTRSNTQSFYLNLMVRQGAESSFLFDGAPATALFPPASFQPAPGPPGTKWKAARFGPFTTAQIAVGQHLIQNTSDLFHMAFVNGNASSGCMYGYFSDFNELKVNAVVAGTGSATVLKTCFGTPVQLYASGGTKFTWTPGTSLSNDTIYDPFANPSVTTLYNVTVEGACDLKDSAKITVAVSTPISANFSTDKVTGCAPLTVNFTDHSSGVYSWQYDFGDTTALVLYDNNPSTLSILPPPASGVTTHVFNNPYSVPITYHVQLLVKNADLCSELYYKDITVYPSMNAAFTQTAISGCNPLTVGFTNNSTTNTADSYLWDYGDGFTQTMANTTGVSHTYNNSLSTDAVYPMQLIATNPYGCKDTASQNITVAAYIKADFDIDKASGCSPLSVGFNNKATGGINNWTLTNYGSGPQPASPTTPGNYTLTYNNTNPTATDIVNNLTLTVTNTFGCSNSITKPITVYPEVHAGITVPSTTFCSPSSVVFGSATSTGPINTYAWIFGDGGTSSLNNPTHTYTNNTNASINPTVTLEVTSIRGCVDVKTQPLTIYSLVKADFSVDTPKFCSPFKILIDNNSQGGIVTYHWDYGDGSPISATSSDHTHTYTNVGNVPLTRTLDLTVTNEGGCTSNTSRLITVYPEVHTDYTLDQSVGCNPVLTTFGYTGTSTATLFNWTFGDGGSSVMQNPIHEFENNTTGDVTYNVKLLGRSIYGCKDSTTKTVTVYSKVDANFAINNSFAGCSPLGVDINNVLWGGNSTYRWDWDGNGSIDSTTNTTTSNFRHTFINQAGVVQNLPLTLTVQNTHGCPEQMVRLVQVYPEVTSAYSPLNQVGCNPFPLTFSNTSVLTGSANKPDYYSWWFGDGGTSNLLNPSHEFVNSSAVNDTTYHMWLASSTIYGCVDTLKTSITVHPRLDASFVIDSASRCTPFFLPITPTAIGATTYQWVFGDGTPNGNSSVAFQHQYDNPDPNNLVTYPLTLIVTNGGGACHDTLVRPVRVYPKVISKFIPDKVAGCNPLTVNFTNQSTGNATYVWDFGNSASSNVLNPSVVFEHADRTAEHTYTVTLKTNNELGCESLSDTVITVYPKVEADFATDNLGGCSPLAINLNNLTVSSAYDYQWSMNSLAPFSTVASPSALNLVNPSNTPPALQVDTLKLITYYKNSHACSATAQKIVTVYPRVYPDFTMNAAGCQPFSVTFTNTTRSINGTATYYWNFGNQISSIDKEPSTTYFNTDFYTNKTYDVSLVATSENGCVDSVKHPVTVYPKPFASYKFLSPSIACAPFDFELQNLSKGTSLTYYYDFGDGADSVTTSAANMVHPYQNPSPDVASYLLKLRTVTQYGCKDSTSQMVYTYPMVTAAFNFDPVSAHCNPYTVNLVNSSTNSYYYSWNFDDGQGTGLENPSHLFVNNTEQDKVYNVKLTAESQYECSDTTSHNMTIYAAPVAAFQPNPPLKIFPDATFGIDNQTKPAADTWNYRWTLGDGQTRYGKDFNSYTYSSWGPKADGFRYEVILESWNNNCYDSTHRYVYLLPASPVAIYTSDTSATCSPLVVHFYNNSTYGDTLRWDFGDGTTSTDWEPIHTFNNPGYYNVKLTVYGDGGVAYRYKTFHVFQNPKANFEINPQTLLLPDADAHFFNTSENAARYYWEFGDGSSTSSDKDPIFRYSKLGVYNVKLTVWTDPQDGNCMNDTTIAAAVRVIGQGKLAYPNAFTPSLLGSNGGAYDDVDYQNQVFHPVWEGVSQYVLRIYNRWGEQIFESHDVKIGWDGYYQGKLCEPDVYVWKAEGTFTNGQHFSKMGDLTLIR